MICHILFDVGLLQPSPRAPLEGIVERAARGDRDALSALYRTHFEEIRTFARRLVGCDMAADDLVHDVFLSLPAALGRFRGACSMRSYLLSITVRSARSHLRAAQRRRRLEARAVEAAPTRPDVPLVCAERRQLAHWLSQALDELPLAQRAAFVLCEVEERSSAEVADILGANAGTIRARVFHAKRKLRERLAELAPESAPAELTEVAP